MNGKKLTVMVCTPTVVLSHASVDDEGACHHVLAVKLVVSVSW